MAAAESLLSQSFALPHALACGSQALPLLQARSRAPSGLFLRYPLGAWGQAPLPRSPQVGAYSGKEKVVVLAAPRFPAHAYIWRGPVPQLQVDPLLHFHGGGVRWRKEQDGPGLRPCARGADSTRSAAIEGE